MKEKGFVYARYVDDFSFSFTLDSEKEDFLKEINLICREHNLIINESKTSIDCFPFINNLSKSNLFSFFENFSSESATDRWIREINNFIDYCINEEYSGNKGAIKSIFPVIKNSLKRKKVSNKKVDLIFSKKNTITNFNLFEKILDLSLKDSRLTNRFLSFFEDVNQMGFQSKKASVIVKEYFKNHKMKYNKKIAYYSENHFNQELYQILLYVVEFEVKNLLSEKELLDLINENTDDFSLILITIIYLRKKYKKTNDFFGKIDQLFVNTHKNYPVKNSARMAEKYWLFRYFIYFLQSKKTISKTEVNSYCKMMNYKSGKNGYETELNWKYVRSSPNQSLVNEFFNELIENEIWLVYCGENGDFKYLPK